MGEVWEARHRDGLPVAIKLITGDLVHLPEFRAAFRSEVRAVAALQHPRIVHVLDLLEVDAEVEAATGGALLRSTPAMVTELATGGTLAEVAMPMPWPRLQELLVQLLTGLAHAHARGVLHRDLKPSNVLLSGIGDLRRGPRITDFGLAGWRDELVDDDHDIGTPAYMPPEQLQGRGRDQGPWTDLYALGCVAWELATGTTPFAGQGTGLRRLPELVTEGMPEHFEGWLRRMLAPDRRRRFPTAAAACQALVLRAERRSWEAVYSPLPPPMWGAGVGLFALRAMPVVGRREAQQELWQTLERVVDAGVAETVTICGAAGVGKTHLARWLCERAEELGLATSLRAGGGGLRRAVAQRLGASLHGGPAVRRAVARFLRETGVRRPATARALGDWLVGETSAAGVAREAVERIAATQPLVLWFDEPSAHDVEVVRALVEVQPIRPLPILVVLSCRDPVDGVSGGRVSLAPLAPQASQRLVRGLLRLDEATATRLEVRAAGNPSFAVQLVGDWVGRGVLVAGPDGFRPAEGAQLPIPDALHEVWLARIAGLADEGALHAIERAAVLGTSVDAAEWIASCKVDGVSDARARSEAVEALLADGVVRVDERGFRFTQPMLRESLVRRAAEGGRVEAHHEACAAMLQGAGSEPDGLRLGEHLLRAGRAAAAIEPLWAGVEGLVVRGLFREVLAGLILHDEALRGAGAGPGDHRWGRHLLMLSRACRVRRRHQEAVRYADEAIRRAEQHGWAEILVRAKQARGFCAAVLGQHVEARALLQPVIAEHRRAGRAAAQAECQRVWALLLRQAGDLDGAEGQLLEAEVAARGTGRSTILAEVLRDLGVVANVRGDGAAALTWFDRAVALAHEAGSPVLLAQCVNNRAEALRSLGRLDEASEGYERALTLQELHASRVAIEPRINLALVCLGRRDVVGASRWLDEAQALLGHDGSASLRGYVHALRLPVLAATGAWDVWDRHLSLARAGLTGLVDPDLVGPLQWAVALAEGDGEVTKAAQAGALAAEHGRRRR